MLSKYQKIDTQIQNIEKQLKKLPPGKLICTQNGNHYKWYQSMDHANTYIPKKNSLLAKQLAYKTYLCLLMEDLSNEKRAIELYLDHYSNISKSTLLLEHPGFNELLKSYFTPLSQELSEWMNSSYEQNSKHPEHLIHKSVSGHSVRSKSEAIIDMMLYTHNIPFRYECALQLGDVTLFPDFTIRHPKTGDIYYWEHFGLMDNPAYSQNVYSKLQLYTSQGIIPTIHLITTYETIEYPLSVDIVMRIIEHYFCDNV